MKIQLKRSNVLQSGAAKEPTASQLEYGELAINYSNSDPAIFLKDSNNNIIRISGVGNIADDGLTNVPAGTTPPTNPTPESGNLWYNSDEGRLYIYYVDANTSQWVDASPDSWDPTVMPDTTNPAAQTGTLDDRYVMENGDTMTGALILPSGTAAAPALGVGSTDNGLYSPGTDEVALATNGTGRLFVDASGNVGVGTTSPDGLLHLASSGNAILRIQNTDAGDSAIINFVGNSAGTAEGQILYNLASDYMRFYVARSEAVRIDSSGRVGVGTSDPQSFVTLNGGNGSGFTDVLQLSAGTNASNSGPGLTFNANFNNYSISKNWQTGVIRSAGSNAAADYQGYLAFYTNNGSSAGDVTEKVRIDSSGRVGIGTTSPGSLNTDGNNLVVGSGSGNEGITIYSGTTSASNIFFADGANSSSWHQGVIQYNHSDDSMGFRTNGYNERMRIDSSGRLLSPNGAAFYGTVSNSGNGAIMERGSNANGEFVKFADGTLICTILNSFYSTGAAPYNSTWTFPAASVIVCNVFGTKTSLRGYKDGATVTPQDSKTTDAILRFSNNDITFTVTAVGRWY